MSIRIAWLAAALAACATDAPPGLSAPSDAVPQRQQESTRSLPTNVWRAGEVAWQGYLGAVSGRMGREGGTTGDIHDRDFVLPTLGGGAQWKLFGEGVDLGLEGLAGIGWRGNVATSAGAAAADADLFLLEVYGGPFASVTMGDGMRLYGGAGPMLGWASYHQDSGNPLAAGDGSGLGVGCYVRTGVEFNVSRTSMVGLGIRWSRMTMDLTGGLGDLEVDGFLVMFTASQGF